MQRRKLNRRAKCHLWVIPHVRSNKHFTCSDQMSEIQWSGELLDGHLFAMSSWIIKRSHSCWGWNEEMRTARMASVFLIASLSPLTAVCRSQWEILDHLLLPNNRRAKPVIVSDWMNEWIKIWKKCWKEKTPTRSTNHRGEKQFFPRNRHRIQSKERSETLLLTLNRRSVNVTSRGERWVGTTVTDFSFLVQLSHSDRRSYWQITSRRKRERESARCRFFPFFAARVSSIHRPWTDREIETTLTILLWSRRRETTHWTHLFNRKRHSSCWFPGQQTTVLVRGEQSEICGEQEMESLTAVERGIATRINRLPTRSTHLAKGSFTERWMFTHLHRHQIISSVNKKASRSIVRNPTNISQRWESTN